ncbi:unnamed protein product [Penicillium glandicola]
MNIVPFSDDVGNYDPSTLCSSTTRERRMRASRRGSIYSGPGFTSSFLLSSFFSSCVPPIPSYPTIRLLLQASLSLQAASRPIGQVRGTSYTTPHYLNLPSSSGVLAPTNMSGYHSNMLWVTAPGTNPPDSRTITGFRLLEASIMTLKFSIDERAAMANNVPLDLEAMEALSLHIWVNKVTLARLIRGFWDPRGSYFLEGLFRRVIGTLPNDDGSMP